MEIIGLSKSNYKDYLPIDIAAFSIADPGACGEPGGVRIIDSKAKIYRLNYVFGEWDDDLFEICPLSKECFIEKVPDSRKRFLLRIAKGCYFIEKVPDGYQFAYLGLGNYLFVKNDFWKEFNDMKNSYKGDKILYSTWLDFMLEILKRDNRR